MLMVSHRGSQKSKPLQPWLWYEFNNPPGAVASAAQTADSDPAHNNITVAAAAAPAGRSRLQKLNSDRAAAVADGSGSDDGHSDEGR